MDYPNGLPKWTALKWTTPKNNIPNEYYLIFLAASRYKFRLCSSSDLYSHVDHWKIDRDNADVNAGKQSIVFVGIVWSETYIYSNLFFFRDKIKKNWFDSWLTRGWFVTRGWLGLAVGSCNATTPKEKSACLFCVQWLQNKEKQSVTSYNFK